LFTSFNCSLQLHQCFTALLDTRAQTQWQRFGGDVDDIIPLAVRSISQQNIDNIDVNWMNGPTTEEIRKQQEAVLDYHIIL
jgi:hypothetical protein